MMVKHRRLTSYLRDKGSYSYQNSFHGAAEVGADLMKNDPNGRYYGKEGPEEDVTFFEKAIIIRKRMGLMVLFKRAFFYILAITPVLFNWIAEAITYHFIHRTFIFKGKKMRYFLDIYHAVDSERSIEIPIAMDFISENAGFRGANKIKGSSRILELGNVVNHYFEFEHIVIDKYEKWPSVLNVDIMDFSPDEKYDLIISVSTVEHIGYDEQIRERGKSLKAVTKLGNMLGPSGKMLITVPLGYNPEIDEMVRDSLFPFTQRYFMKRVSYTNTWRETTMDDALKYKYGLRYNHANSVAILIFDKE